MTDFRLVVLTSKGVLGEPENLGWSEGIPNEVEKEEIV